MKLDYQLIQVLVRGVTIIVQPLNAEAYEFPAGIAEECMMLAKETGTPVVLKGKMGDRVTFQP